MQLTDPNLTRDPKFRILKITMECEVIVPGSVAPGAFRNEAASAVEATLGQVCSQNNCALSRAQVQAAAVGDLV